MSQLPQESVQAFRMRALRALQRLLLRAFGAVVVLMVLLNFGIVFLVLNLPVNWNPAYTPPIAAVLENYYWQNNGWAGVEKLSHANPENPAPSARMDWNTTIVLDQAGRVVLDRGRADTALVGGEYPRKMGEFRIALIVNKQPVGAVVLELDSIVHPWQFFSRAILPIGLVSIFLGILTALIGLLLMQRVVNPLADVIAAAQAVAAGDLSARAPISERHDDLGALNDHFNYMAAQLERNDRERRNLLVDISHELRTPLTIMRGRLEGILDGIYPADAEHIAPALEETYLLERLVDDLRLLALAETRQLHFEPRRLDLSDLARRAVDLFQAQAEEKNIRLLLEIEPEQGLVPPILADPQRTEQVIGNLLGNAVRYTHSGDQVWVQVRTIDPAAGGGHCACVELSVADNGPGVAESDLPHLFDRFWRGEKSRARASGGAGLGLAIARQLVEAQGGRISASNRPAGGLCVSFEFPAAPDHDLLD